MAASDQTKFVAVGFMRAGLSCAVIGVLVVLLGALGPPLIGAVGGGLALLGMLAMVMGAAILLWATTTSRKYKSGGPPPP